MTAGTFEAIHTDRELGFAQPEKIRAFQLDQLKRHLSYCQQHSPFYRKRIDQSQWSSAELTLDTYSTFPLTDKSDIEAFNQDFCAVPSEEIVDIVLSSGTTGKPTRILYTESDLQRLAYNEEVSLAACGITASDTALLTCTIDRCFIAGLAYFSGLRKIGTAVIRNGQNSLESHASILSRLHPTVIVGVPSFLRKLGHYLIDTGQSDALKPVQKLVCIGEPIRDEQLNLTETGADLESTYQARVYSTYASSETVTSFCECDAGQGGHLLPDLGWVEIVDNKGHPLPAGSIGEVVMTPFGINGMPLLRFKTGDVSYLMTEQCRCGRYSPRLAPILGRKAQMLKIKGTTLYPQAINAVMESISNIEEYYVSADAETDLSDSVTIHAAAGDGSLTSEFIEGQLQARLRVKPQVILEPAVNIRQRVFHPSSRKPIRFFDNRKKQQ